MPKSEREYDREICICFHVSLGKIAKFARLRKPRYASELSNCYGAGTGCGWCVPFLEKIYEKAAAGEDPTPDMKADEYRARRDDYRRSLGLKPGEKEQPVGLIRPEEEIGKADARGRSRLGAAPIGEDLIDTSLMGSDPGEREMEDRD